MCSASFHPMAKRKSAVTPRIIVPMYPWASVKPGECVALEFTSEDYERISPNTNKEHRLSVFRVLMQLAIQQIERAWGPSHFRTRATLPGQNSKYGVLKVWRHTPTTKPLHAATKFKTHMKRRGPASAPRRPMRKDH